MVKEVYLHLHLDEVLAYFIAFMFGEHMFPGIRTAEVAFVTEVPNLTEAQWRKKGVLCIGVGKSRFNEHRDGDHARLPGYSASRLMLEYLGLEGNLVLNALMREVNGFDNEAECPDSHLANILKLAYRHLDVVKGVIPAQAQHELLQMVFDILNLVCENMQVGTTKTIQEDELPTFVRALVERHPDFPPGVVRDRVIRKIVKTHWSDQGTLLLGLGHVFECLIKTVESTNVESAELAQGYMIYILQLLFQNQKEFLEYQEEIRRRSNSSEREKIWFEVPVSREGRQGKIWAAMLETDHPRAHSVLRHFGATVSVVINSTGNVSIQGNQKHVKQNPWLYGILNLSTIDLCSMLRFLDLAPSRRKKTDLKSLSDWGNSSQDKFWFLDAAERLQILNGSHVHDVEPTKLTRIQIRGCVRSAYSISLLDQWKLKHVPRARAERLKQAKKVQRQQQEERIEEFASLANLAAALDQAPQ